MRHLVPAIAAIITAFIVISSYAYSGASQKGDVNNDGSINVLDMVTIANHVLGIAALDEQGLWRADVNGPVGNFDGDGTVDVLDMVKIANIILGVEEYPAETITDIDGNTYRTVQIGEQCWMAENLKVTHYRNGDQIPEVTDSLAWIRLTGAHCSYNNDTTYVATYGRLYNWYAVSDSRNLAPAGWHVPSDGEWQTLVDYLGGDAVAGGKLKESGTSHWQSPNTGATNESGFTALPGGYRFYTAHFNFLGSQAIFWSSTEIGPDYAWYRILGYFYLQVTRDDLLWRCGMSVRCVKD